MTLPPAFTRAQMKITKLHPEAKLPRVATEHSIGSDIYSCLLSDSGRAIKKVIPPGMTVMVPTGILAVAEPPFSIFVCSRSGLAAQRQLFVTNAPGIVDPDYRGEIKVLLHNAGSQNQWIEHHTRIAQLVMTLCPIPTVSESAIDLRFLESERGDAGFGSTGDE